jgi:hypothetical protein
MRTAQQRTGLASLAVMAALVKGDEPWLNCFVLCGLPADRLVPLDAEEDDDDDSSTPASDSARRPKTYPLGTVFAPAVHDVFPDPPLGELRQEGVPPDLAGLCFPQGVRLFPGLPEGVVADYFVPVMSDIKGRRFFIHTLVVWEPLSPAQLACIDSPPSHEVFGPRALVLVSRSFMHAHKRALMQLYRLSFGCSEAPWERSVAALLAIPAPPPGQLTIHHTMGDETLVIQRPPINRRCSAENVEKPLQLLFESMSAANVEILFRCVLSGKSMVIHSASLYMLSAFSVALLALFYPLDFAGAFIPVLPCSEGALHLLRFPGLMIVGLPTERWLRGVVQLPEELVRQRAQALDPTLPKEPYPSLKGVRRFVRLAVSAGVVVVDVDMGQVILPGTRDLQSTERAEPGSGPEAPPALPSRASKKLLESLKQCEGVFAHRGDRWFRTTVCALDSAFVQAARPDDPDEPERVERRMSLFSKKAHSSCDWNDVRGAFFRVLTSVLRDYRSHIVYGAMPPRWSGSAAASGAAAPGKGHSLLEDEYADLAPTFRAELTPGKASGRRGGRSTSPFQLTAGVWFDMERFIGTHYMGSEARPLLEALLATQSFQQFVQARARPPTGPGAMEIRADVLFFDESIDAKRDRYAWRRIRGSSSSTPFLTSTEYRHSRVMVVPGPSTSELPPRPVGSDGVTPSPRAPWRAVPLPHKIDRALLYKEGGSLIVPLEPAPHSHAHEEDDEEGEPTPPASSSSSEAGRHSVQLSVGQYPLSEWLLVVERSKHRRERAFDGLVLPKHGRAWVWQSWLRWQQQLCASLRLGAERLRRRDPTVSTDLRLDDLMRARCEALDMWIAALVAAEGAMPPSFAQLAGRSVPGNLPRPSGLLSDASITPLSASTKLFSKFEGQREGGKHRRFSLKGRTTGTLPLVLARPLPGRIITDSATHLFQECMKTNDHWRAVAALEILRCRGALPDPADVAALADGATRSSLFLQQRIGELLAEAAAVRASADDDEHEDEVDASAAGDNGEEPVDDDDDDDDDDVKDDGATVTAAAVGEGFDSLPTATHDDEEGDDGDLASPPATTATAEDDEKPVLLNLETTSDEPMSETDETPHAKPAATGMQRMLSHSLIRRLQDTAQVRGGGVLRGIVQRITSGIRGPADAEAELSRASDAVVRGGAAEHVVLDPRPAAQVFRLCRLLAQDAAPLSNKCWQLPPDKRGAALMVWAWGRMVESPVSAHPVLFDECFECGGVLTEPRIRGGMSAGAHDIAIACSFCRKAGTETLLCPRFRVGLGSTGSPSLLSTPEVLSPAVLALQLDKALEPLDNADPTHREQVTEALAEKAARSVARRVGGVFWNLARYWAGEGLPVHQLALAMVDGLPQAHEHNRGDASSSTSSPVAELQSEPSSGETATLSLSAKQVLTRAWQPFDAELPADDPPAMAVAVRLLVRAAQNARRGGKSARPVAPLPVIRRPPNALPAASKGAK